MLTVDEDLPFGLSLSEGGFPEEGFGNVHETHGQGHRNGYNLIERSSVSCIFCGINKGL